MSIIVNNITYRHPDGETLFENISFSVAAGQKASLIGDNGTGKSTMLRLIAWEAMPVSGEVSVAGLPYRVPQHFGQYDGLTIAGALGIDAKITALRSIMVGDVSEVNYTVLNDDWAIEQRAIGALAYWGLEGLSPDIPLGNLSGGEKTKVFLAGIAIHQPRVVLLDEPTNHLDTAARGLLARFICGSAATVLIVSHDRSLLELPEVTLELTRSGVVRYGGNYEFYRQQRDISLDALRERIGEKDKALNAARAKARQVMEQKRKSDSRAPARHLKARSLPGKIDKMRASAQESDAKLRDIHSAKIAAIEEQRAQLREKLPPAGSIKIALEGSGLHRGKMLVTAREINYAYPGGPRLWEPPLSFRIAAGDRVAVTGTNGSGKTTLLRLILGDLEPAEGEITRAGFNYIYVDQEYSLIDNRLTVFGQLEKCNSRNLPEYWLKQELHRFLFPAGEWYKPCEALSGGEKMRLTLCCMLITDDSPDIFVLDEPTNNLDIRSMEMLTSSVREYSGTVLLISHDRYFIREAGVSRTIALD